MWAAFATKGWQVLRRATWPCLVESRFSPYPAFAFVNFAAGRPNDWFEANEGECNRFRCNCFQGSVDLPERLFQEARILGGDLPTEISLVVM